MIQNRRFGALSSSENPEQLGSTVKGIILGLSVFIIWGAQASFGIELTPENVQEMATDIGAIVSATWLAYGLVKKVVITMIDWWYRRG